MTGLVGTHELDQTRAFTRRRWRGYAYMPIFPPKITVESSISPSLVVSKDNAIVAPGENTYGEHTAETSATPSTVVLTVSSGMTGVFLYVGDFGTDELDTPACDLYVDIGGSVHVIHDVTRFSSHLLRASSGQTVKVGARTLDNTTGVTLSFGIVDGTYITATTDPTATTSNANMDFAPPTLWEPANAHVTLDDEHSIIKFNDKGADFKFLVSESPDGLTDWTKPKLMMMRSGENARYFARYQYVALMALAASTTISVTVDGAVSGAANTWTLDDIFTPLASGNTRSVSTDSDGFGGDQGTAGQNLEYALANAVSGDVVELATATYTLSRILFDDGSNNSYDKNIAIIAADGATPTITGYGCGHPDAGSTLILQGITFDFATVDVANTDSIGFVHCHEGTMWLYDCTATGPGSGTAKNLVGVSSNGVFNAFASTFTTAGEDVINGNLSTSLTRTYCCTVSTAGASGDTNENLFTPHNGAVMIDWGSTFIKNGGGGPAVIHAGTSYIYLFLTTCQKGSASSFDLGGLNARVRLVFGVTVDELAPDSYCLAWVLCRITFVAGSVCLKPNSSEYFLGNIFTGSAATSGNTMIEVRGDVTIRGNLFSNIRVPITNNSSGTYSLAGRSIYVDQNTFTATNLAHISIVDNAVDEGTWYIRNNIFENSSSDILVATGATGVIVTNGNIFGFSVDADYTTRAGGSLGASDSNNTTPNIDATTKRPSVSDTDGTHNCDNEGATSLSGFGYLTPDACGAYTISSERPRGCFGVPNRELSNTTYHPRRWAA